MPKKETPQTAKDTKTLQKDHAFKAQKPKNQPKKGQKPQNWHKQKLMVYNFTWDTHLFKNFWKIDPLKLFLISNM